MHVQQDLVVSDREITDATDKIILPQSFLDTIIRVAGGSDLPYPITFAVRAQNRTTHVGVREFSAEEGFAVIPNVVLDNLAIKAGMPVSISMVNLEKGESVKLRPLASGYDLNQDWKIALEGAFRSTYTTLTQGDVIRLKSGVRFLVDEVKPETAVCIVDTDLEVELEPLSEEQARETVRINAENKQGSQSTPISVDEPVESTTTQPMYYVLQKWDRAGPVFIRLEASNPDVALVVGSSRDTALTRCNLWSTMTSKSSKEIEIRPTNALLEHCQELAIGVSADTASQFILTVSQTAKMADQVVPGAEEVRCRNCATIVPKRSLVLHERHCLRHNSKCPHPACNFIFRQGIDSKHWHCPQCDEGGEGDLDLHGLRFHTSQVCDCGIEFTTLPTLAAHRATDCPDRQITCQFCHLIVPQGDSTTVSYTDKSLGYTAHEAACGARTTTCETCSRLVQLKDLPLHLRIHDSSRRTHTRPLICHNENCVATPASSNKLGLCEECFGPLYSTQEDDAQGSKLAGRVRRRYASQLMNGCRRAGCQNVAACATAKKEKMTYAAALARADDLLAHDDKFFFCVGEAMARKRTRAEGLACEGIYHLSWCCRAVALAGDELGRARSWLEREAVRLDEEGL